MQIKVKLFSMVWFTVVKLELDLDLQLDTITMYVFIKFRGFCFKHKLCCPHLVA